MSDICHLCGRNLALVGRVHRCVPPSDPRVLEHILSDGKANKGAAKAAPVAKPVEAAKKSSSTYKHRNAEARRAYMRDYMRKRAGRGK